MSDGNGSAVNRDILLRVLFVSLAVSVPVLLVLDYRLFPGRFLEHLPDHVLALIAIAAGLAAIYYERKLDKEFDQQKRDLSASFSEQRAEIKTIIEAVHTRYIGDWPDHISEITTLVKDTEAGDQLLIFVDFIGYAHYTRRELFDKYLEALQMAQREKVKVKILLHSEKALRKHMDKQFPKEKADPLAAKKLAEEYRAAYQHYIKKASLETYSEFVTAVLYVQARFCNSLLEAVPGNPAEIASMKDSSSDETEKDDASEMVYYWLVRQGDNLRKMVFAYSRFAGVGQGYAFRTADPRLMAIFCRDFERKWNEARILATGAESVPDAWKEAQSWQQVKAGAKSATTSGQPGG